MGVLFKIAEKTLPSVVINNIKLRKSKIEYLQLEEALLKNWHKTKVGQPPHHIKQETILKYAEANKIKLFVETGTYLGVMIDSMKNKFEKLYSIELSDFLFNRAKKMFKNHPNVQMVLGDSGVKIADVLSELKQPAIFWLDGHYSGGVTAKADIETPILAELRKILDHPIKQHIIIIDDARLFNGKRDYPTIEEITKFTLEIDKNLQIFLEHDFIIIKH